MTFFQQFIDFFTDTTNPLLRILEFLLLSGGVVAAFLVFYTTRDILLRSRSLLLQIFSIVLVAVLPVMGFFLYLLFRPSQTLKEREVESLLHRILKHLPKEGDTETK